MNQEEEKTEEFSPDAFLGDNMTMENETPESTTETKEEETEDTSAEASDESEQQEEVSTAEAEESEETSEEASADSDWGSVGTDEKPEEVEDKTDDGASTEDSAENNEAWKTIADDLGYEVKTVDELKQRLLHQKELAKKGLSNEKVDTWKGLKALEDETLVRKELEAKKMSEEEIEDEIDIMIENRTLKGKARDIRRDLDVVIDREIESLTEQSEPQGSMSTEEAEEARRELKDYLSKTDKIFGGRVNEKQKEEHFQYIENGTYFDEVTEDAESIAKAAWLWRYRDQISKAMESKGFEKGKSAILDEMVNPELGKSNHIPEPEGDFSSTRFLDTEQM